MKRLVRWAFQGSAAVATVLVAVALISLFRPSPPWPDVLPPPGATARWRWFDRYILFERILQRIPRHFSMRAGDLR